MDLKASLFIWKDFGNCCRQCVVSLLMTMKRVVSKCMSVHLQMHARASPPWAALVESMVRNTAWQGPTSQSPQPD